jgi:SAM-dependent methyltransferase
MKYYPNPPLRLVRRFLRSREYNGLGGAVAHSSQRLFQSLKSHGIRGTFRRAFIHAPTAPGTPPLPATHPFDLLHGTETGGHISSGDLSAVTLSALYATGYLGVPPSALRPALAALPIRHQDFSFVDIGCGKGRALFIAAEFPFPRIIGVEIAQELCETAQANVALKPEWQHRISVVNQDACTYIFPDGPLALFLYHPFFTPMLRRLLENLERQLCRSSRPVYLLHADFCTNPANTQSDYLRYRNMIQSFPRIRPISEVVYPLSSEDAASEPAGCTSKLIACYTTEVAP